MSKLLGCRPDPLGGCRPQTPAFLKNKGVRGLAPGGFGRQPNKGYIGVRPNSL